MKKTILSIFLLTYILSNSFIGFAQNKTALPFSQFIKLFPVENKPLPFAVGKVWFNKQTKQAVLDKLTIRKYITTSKIWLNNLQKNVIAESETFYPVAQINLHPAFYSLLITNSYDEVRDVYLLTYTKEGIFVDGVCVIIGRLADENFYRSTIFAGGMVLMVKENKQGKPRLFTFDIWDIGSLHGKL